MRLFSYVVSRDYGLAPNPFFGTCTLATCKPDIRSTASAGDWIVGTGSKTKKKDGHFVYVMQVAEVMTFNQYWTDARFQLKKPHLAGSLKQAFGDNIYLRGRDGRWQQTNSHQNLEDGSPNLRNTCRDIKADGVLVGGMYIYWGRFRTRDPAAFQELQRTRHL